MKNIVIIPTGDEIKKGIILDTDSPMIMQNMLKMYSDCTILKTAPVNDEESEISREIYRNVEQGADLIILIGGSGEGHRYSSTLGKDYTHTVLMDILEDRYSTELYGKNGHMWCKLVCGIIDNTVVINVPGPYEEAKVAIQSFNKFYGKIELEKINKEMAKAVMGQYGKK